MNTTELDIVRKFVDSQGKPEYQYKTVGNVSVYGLKNKDFDEFKNDDEKEFENGSRLFAYWKPKLEAKLLIEKIYAKKERSPYTITPLGIAYYYSKEEQPGYNQLLICLAILARYSKIKIDLEDIKRSIPEDLSNHFVITNFKHTSNFLRISEINETVFIDLVFELGPATRITLFEFIIKNPKIYLMFHSSNPDYSYRKGKLRPKEVFTIRQFYEFISEKLLEMFCYLSWKSKSKGLVQDMIDGKATNVSDLEINNRNLRIVENFNVSLIMLFKIHYDDLISDHQFLNELQKN